MKAIRIQQFGPTKDVLQYEDVLVTEPKAGEVLVKVAATSLNRTRFKPASTPLFHRFVSAC